MKDSRGLWRRAVTGVTATVVAIATGVLITASAAGAATAGATGTAPGQVTGKTATPAAAGSGVIAQPAATPSRSARTGMTSKVYLEVTPETASTMPGGATPAMRMTPQGTGPVHPNAVTPSAAISTPVESITPDECLANRSAFSGNGYAKGRFAACQAYHLHAWHIECDWFFGCDQVGTADADLTDIQYTDDGDRGIYVAQQIGNWRVFGDMSEITLTLNATCSASPGSGPCNTLFGSPTTELIDDWAAVGTDIVYYSYEQPDTSGTGTLLLSRAHLNWHLTVAGGENGPASRTGPNSNVRCDAASYIIRAGGGNGCVFPWAAAPTWVIHRSTTPESAQNIYEAQTTPNATQPPSIFKFILGAPGVGPLHRDAVPADIDAHRGTAVAACKQYFPTTYPAPNTDCDEYPFASTLEGAVNYGNFRNYVVKPIDRDDNQAAGRALGRFYAQQRILGSAGINDAFYVSVQP